MPDDEKLNNPSPLDRTLTRATTAAILEAVRSDASISDAIDITAWKGAYPCGPIHDLLTALAMEVELMAGERDRFESALKRIAFEDLGWRSPNGVALGALFPKEES
jgi:hypothetical protein